MDLAGKNSRIFRRRMARGRQSLSQPARLTAPFGSAGTAKAVTERFFALSAPAGHLSRRERQAGETQIFQTVSDLLEQKAEAGASALVFGFWAMFYRTRQTMDSTVIPLGRESIKMFDILEFG